MKNTLLFLAVFVSLFCSAPAARAGGDAPKPLGSDVVWSIDTLGSSPFKKAFQGMWFAPDGKIVIPQWDQLFLLDPETGKIVDKKKLPCRLLVDFMYSKNKTHLILYEDSTLYMYDIKSYKLVKQFNMPEEFKDKTADYFEAGKRFATVGLSSDSKTIVAVFMVKNPRANQVWTLNVETGEYKKIMEPYLFSYPVFSPNGKYFTGQKCDTQNKNDRPTVRIYDATTFEQIIDTKNAGMGLSNIVNSFSPGCDSIFVIGTTNEAWGSFMLDMVNNYKLTNLNFPGKRTSDYQILNDSLAYIYSSFENGNTTREIMLYNFKKNIVMYDFVVPEPLNWGHAYVSPDKKSLALLNINTISKLIIPYDKLTKTEQEISKINNGFTLSPNPFYDIVTYSIYLSKDQNIKYSINQIDGKEIKTGEIGACSAGYATGSLYLQDIPVGEYIVVFYGEEGRVAQGKVCLVR